MEKVKCSLRFLEKMQQIMEQCSRGFRESLEQYSNKEKQNISFLFGREETSAGILRELMQNVESSGKKFE